MSISAPVRTTASSAAVQRHHNEGHGRRLTAAFEALEAFPALAESRNRLLRVVRDERASMGDMVAAVESDVALAIAVLRIANRAQTPKRGQGARHQPRRRLRGEIDGGFGFRRFRCAAPPANFQNASGVRYREVFAT